MTFFMYRQVDMRLLLAALRIAIPCVALLSVTVLCAAEKPQLDVRVLIDVSGSMKKNDPKNLRRPALRLLTGLLPKGVQAGVWSFDRDVNVVAPLQAVDEDWREQAIQGSGQIHSSGQFTHIEGALQVAVGDWYQADPQHNRHLILLTDGVVDVSHTSAHSTASRKRILDKILPELRAAKARVHTIALSRKADRGLLKRLSEETGGLHEAISDASRMQRIFLNLFEQASNPDAIPLKDNRFSVDAGINEATVILFRGKQKFPSKLIDPDGREYTEITRPDNIRWHRDQGFEMITISAPAPGEWRVVAPVDPDNRVLVVTDLKMHLDELPTLALAEEKMGLRAHFTNKGRKLTDDHFVGLVTVTAVLAGDGLPRRLVTLKAMDNPGDFGNILPMPAKPGRYTLTLTGKGETFSRLRRHQFEVRDALRVKRDEQSRELVRFRIEVDAELLQAAEVSAMLTTADGEMQQMVLPVQENRYEVEVSALGFTGKGELQLEVKGEHRGHAVVIRPDREQISGIKPDANMPASTEPESVVAAPPVVKEEPDARPEPKVDSQPAVTEPPVPEESGVDLKGWLVFAAINLLVLMALGGGWMWWKKRKMARELEVLNEDEQAD
jgi:hypothetical protein